MTTAGVTSAVNLPRRCSRRRRTAVARVAMGEQFQTPLMRGQSQNLEHSLELCVRNTFLDRRSDKVNSLDDDQGYQIREAQSCPASICGDSFSEDGGQEDENADKDVGSDHSAAMMPLGSSSCDGSGDSSTSTADNAQHEASVDLEGTICIETGKSRTLISIAELTVEDTPYHGVPNKGSRAHAFWACKPCAFVHTKGCESGVDCHFCHLCVPGEKNRRRKEKKSANRQFRRSMQFPSNNRCNIEELVPVPVGPIIYYGHMCGLEDSGGIEAQLTYFSTAM